ncbi:MAG: hypothetical protein HY292_26525 [Planctomycetes bacterium]|nr:hypothetical protein [Planctomycetota bacterium]
MNGRDRIAAFATITPLLLLSEDLSSAQSRLAPSFPVELTANLGSSPIFELTNFRVASNEYIAQGSTGAFLASEAGQHRDLNGDGDTDDLVLFVYDASTNTVSNLRLAVQNFLVLVADDLVAFSVSESHQAHTDLNGNGSAFDDIVHIYDRRTHTVSNLGLAGFPMACDSGVVAMGVGEAAQGVDLNGDGDLFDCVVHVYDSTTGLVQNLVLDCGQNVAVLHGGLLAFAVTEANQGNTDLNGNGDTRQQVVHVYDVAANRTINTRLASIYRPLIAGSLVVVEASEVGQGIDLNGDGDATDDCAVAFDTATESIIYFGIAVDGLRANDSVICAAVNEVLQGHTDLNGDGEISGVTAFAIDVATAEVRNLGLQLSDRRAMAAIGTQVAFAVGEIGQGPTDLNGDGDTRDDVLQVYDAATSITTNLGLAISDFQFYPFRPAASQLCFTVDEAAQRADLNGDGDRGDRVFHVYDVADNSVTNLGVGANEGIAEITASGSLFGFRVSESGQGNRDMNGDGDTGDRIVYIYDFLRRSLHPTQVAATDEPVVGDVFALFGASEPRQRNHDLNGDGDAQDNVANVVIAIDRGACEAGTVGLGVGSPVDVLRINGLTRDATVPRNSPVTVSLVAGPSGPAPAPYLLWIWSGERQLPMSLSVNGQTIGCLINPSPFDPTYTPQPMWCLHSTAVSCHGIHTLSSPSSAPFTSSRTSGFAHALTLTLQGVLRDESAANPPHISVTNSVILRVD